MSDMTTESDTTTSGLHIVIPGGEGHLGRLLAERFSSCGHVVTTLTRNSRLSPDPWQKIKWDGKTLGPWRETLDGADVLINLSGRSVDCRYNAKNRQEILRSRVESTTVLGYALQAVRRPPRVWLNASTATIYRHTYDRDMDECNGELGGSESDAPASWRFSIDVARQWEGAFFASQLPATRKVALRAAMVMGPAGEVFPITLRLVRLGLGGAWGDGRQYMSWIHETDLFRAVEFLVNHEQISGVVNLAAPAPLPNEEFLRILRNTWGIPFGLPSRPWMLAAGAFFLRTETELLLKSRRVVPAILQKHGFQFLFPTWSEAAQDLVKNWRAQTSIAHTHEFHSTPSRGNR
jgi:uncharacterized protein (TIGR01777 family)